MESTSYMLVSDLGLAPVVRVSPHLALEDAAPLPAGNRVGTLVVDTEPLTHATKHEVARAVRSRSERRHRSARLVRNVPEFVGYDARVEDAAGILLDSGRRGLVVVDEGRPAGVLTLPTVIAAVLGRASRLGARGVALQVDRRQR